MSSSARVCLSEPRHYDDHETFTHMCLHTLLSYHSIIILTFLSLAMASGSAMRRQSKTDLALDPSMMANTRAIRLGWAIVCVKWWPAMGISWIPPSPATATMAQQEMNKKLEDTIRTHLVYGPMFFGISTWGWSGNQHGDIVLAG